MTLTLDERQQAGLRIWYALVTLFVLYIVFAAFDDITTDNATSFTFEYVALAGCAVWLAFLSVALIRARLKVLGTVSLIALAGALWGQREIGPGITPGLWPAYVVTTGAFLWFVALSFILLVLGWRAASRSARVVQ
jgi:hypothetical protein